MTQITEKMTLSEFEDRLPEFFATGTGTISDDPRLHAFLQENPDAAALVRDFESIVEAAKGLFDGGDTDPSDSVWDSIQSGLKSSPADSSPVAMAAKPVD